jgi:hypothetical protein
MSITTDPNDPRLCHGVDDEPGPQCEVYLVLSEEERAKGFVRPVRTAYIHVGRDLSHYKGIHRMLTEEEQKEYPDKKYVAILTVLTNDDGTFKGGAYVTSDELTAYQFGSRIGGCGGLTTMGQALAETYARDPKFYGSTYCAYCKKHLPVGEFIWAGTYINVGD